MPQHESLPAGGTAGQAPLLDAAFFADPYAACAALRQRGPVHRVRTPDGSSAWLVVDYAHVHQALGDARLSTNGASSNGQDYQGLPLPPALRNDLLHQDPPHHTRLRRMVARALTKQASLALRPRIQQEVDHLLDQVADDHEVDLLQALALPLPLLIVCDLIGVPNHERSRIAAWTETLLVPQDRALIVQAMRDAENQLREIIRYKRARPGDDLLSRLLEARDAHGQLTEDELTSLCFVLLAAGHDTTASFICNALLALLAPRVHWTWLRERPALLSLAVEELLRYDGPLAMAIRRFPSTDIRLGGVRIRAGESVMLSLAAADRDPAVFHDPDQLDLTRTPNPHLSFGRGTHVCPGAPLARLQTEIVLTTLLRRYPDLTLAVRPEELTRRPSHRTRRLERLPVLLHGPGGGAAGPSCPSHAPAAEAEPRAGNPAQALQ